MLKRSFKIGYKIRRTGDVGHRVQTAVPGIDLSGKWLQEAGFLIGQPITVTVSNGQIIIKTS